MGRGRRARGRTRSRRAHSSSLGPTTRSLELRLLSSSGSQAPGCVITASYTHRDGSLTSSRASSMPHWNFTPSWRAGPLQHVVPPENRASFLLVHLSHLPREVWPCFALSKKATLYSCSPTCLESVLPASDA